MLLKVMHSSAGQKTQHPGEGREEAWTPGSLWESLLLAHKGVLLHAHPCHISLRVGAMDPAHGCSSPSTL